jgi:hypothetical protein
VKPISPEAPVTPVAPVAPVEPFIIGPRSKEEKKQLLFGIEVGKGFFIEL